MRVKASRAIAHQRPDDEHDEPGENKPTEALTAVNHPCKLLVLKSLQLKAFN
jgi:hypothetical protein